MQVWVMKIILRYTRGLWPTIWKTTVLGTLITCWTTAVSSQLASLSPVWLQAQLPSINKRDKPNYATFLLKKISWKFDTITYRLKRLFLGLTYKEDQSQFHFHADFHALPTPSPAPCSFHLSSYHGHHPSSILLSLQSPPTRHALYVLMVCSFFKAQVSVLFLYVSFSFPGLHHLCSHLAVYIITVAFVVV